MAHVPRLWWERGSRWFTEVDLSVGYEEELLVLMREAGCRQILKEAIARIQCHGIKVIGGFVLGLDGDTPDIFPEVLAYARELDLPDVQVTFQTAFPGTPLYRRLKAEGRLIQEEALGPLHPLRHQLHA